jgi:hypothetical protein
LVYLFFTHPSNVAEKMTPANHISHHAIMVTYGQI